MWTPTIRYPDPAIEVIDPSFARYRVFSAGIERLATGCRWSEGPVWFGDGRTLLWSDIPNNRILRFDEETGAVSAFRKPSNFANGNTRDRQGRLVTCEHGGRRVTRTEYDGSITVLADAYEGKRLNSPNDVVVASDGAVWFTDPPFGILGNYEGERAEPELPQNVYRLDPVTGLLTAAATDLAGPNGCASPPTNRSSTSSSRGRSRTAASSPSTSQGDGSATSASTSMPAPARRTASAATPTATSGAAGAWATTPSTG